MSKREEIVERALAYPYRIPPRSFLQVGDQAEDLPEGGFDLAGRTAILALGSNAAPTVLARKLGPEASPDPVPVLRATLSDLDVVYSAHISAYGSIPAAIQASPGAEVTTHVVYLTDPQLKRMAETEPNYRLALLRGVSCRPEWGDPVTSVAVYVSRHGCLTVDGSEVALESVTALGRSFQAMSERGVLEHVHSLLRPNGSLEEFIEENVRNEELSRERTAVLRESARPLTWPDTDFLEG